MRGVAWTALCASVAATIAGAGVPPAPSVSHRVTIERRIMSTEWRVILPATAGPRAEIYATRALDEVERLEGVLSEWRPRTEVSRINDEAGRSAVVVGDDTWTVLERSLHFAEISDGAFDPTWAALRGLWNFHGEHPVPPREDAVRARLPLVDWRGVQIDRASRSVRLARAGMAIGFGGIAKGYALDRAAAILRANGVHDFMLDAGGQVEVQGTNEGRPWRMGIRDPRDDSAVLGIVELTSGSLSTSGDYEQYFEYQGRRFHHILDPRTGFPVTHTIAVSVVAENGMDADALSTALFVMPPDRAMALAESLGVAFLRVGPDRSVETSRAMRRVLRAVGAGQPVFERIR